MYIAALLAISKIFKQHKIIVFHAITYYTSTTKPNYSYTYKVDESCKHTHRTEQNMVDTKKYTQ